ncbi:MAG: HlyD family efflux transporter periplasmic adaptor subunit [Gemmatimonadetes bacterium]|nr:HlyD family efflux transporter periplasmic adaptor subunit [Gemmatimonadota bacterium]
MVSLRARDSLLVSRQDVENAETDLEVQQSLRDAAVYGVNQAQAAVEEARDQLSKTIIRAPISGRVTRLNVEQGETVIVGTMNNPGSLVLTVSDLSVMEVVLEVDETDVPEISLGDSAAVELDAFPDLVFPGTVTEIGNSAIRPPSQVAGTGQTPTIDFEVVVTLENPAAELRPDLSATAEVVTDTRIDQLAIPIIALTLREEDREGPNGETSSQDGGRTASEPIEGVFVVKDGIAVFTPVEIGIAGQEYFEVVSGLSEGDSVVSGPYQVVRTLADSSEVRADESPGVEPLNETD